MAFVAMVCAVLGAWALSARGESAQFFGAIGGLAVGVVVAVAINRVLNRRRSPDGA